MRSLMILFFLLFCSLQISYAQKSIIMANSKCCPGVNDVKIPHRLIESYYWTSDICPGPQAVVFKTYGGKERCVNPEASWVNGHMEKVDKRTKK